MWPNMPVSGWQRKKRGLTGGELFAPLAGILLILASIVVCSYFIIAIPHYHSEIFILQIALFFFGVLLLYATQTRIKQNLIEPLAHLRNWTNRIRGGNLSAQIPVPSHGEFARLARDINKLGESLRSLSREMDDKVSQQTERLEQKTHTLEVLYDVAASSNTARNLDELLKRYLSTDILHANIATARLLTEDNQLRIVGCVNHEGKLSDKERLVPIERCLCAQNLSGQVIHCQNSPHLCGNLLPDSNPDPQLQIIAIPLQYQNRTLGIYNLFVEQYQHNEDTEDLLTNIGQHLSLAIEKVRLDEEASRLTLMQERTMLAHELHDSLAQTLASLRIRVTLLLNALGYENLQLAIGEALQLKNGLDEANGELRELLSHFRVPMDERGLIPATEALIERFKKESDITIFFQNECAAVKLSPPVEIQVLHIIQEALTNIRKHSGARHVRVLIRCNEVLGDYRVLIEDDGEGIGDSTVEAKPGEHVGLTIMKERAQRINGELTIDSEPGEGTRIELEFRYIEPEITEQSTV